jgi:GNAT superfamily N-acetyltransferase
MSVSVTILTPRDVPLLIELLDVYKEAFGLTDFVKSPASHLSDLLQHTAMLFLVAQDDQKVVGGLTAFTLPSTYYQGSEIYLYDFAILPARHRQGIGTLLLQELKAYGLRSGVKEIFVQADRPDKHAIDFYLKNGGIPEDVIHFTYPLRPGSPAIF